MAVPSGACTLSANRVPALPTARKAALLAGLAHGDGNGVAWAGTGDVFGGFASFHGGELLLWRRWRHSERAAYARYFLSPGTGRIARVQMVVLTISKAIPVPDWANGGPETGPHRCRNSLTIAVLWDILYSDCGRNLAPAFFVQGLRGPYQK